MIDLAKRAGTARDRADVTTVDRRVSGDRLPALATVAAVGLDVLAAIVLAGDPTLAPADVLPILAAGAGICTGLLLRDAAPSLAWLATIGAAVAAGSVSIDAARGLNPRVVGIGPWEVSAARSSVAAIVTLSLAAGYAVGRTRRIHPIARPLAIGLVAWLVLACAVSLLGVAAGIPTDPAFTLMDLATAPISFYIPSVVLLVSVGIAGDVRAAASRAQHRGGRSGPVPPAAATSRAERWLGLARATAQELWPGHAELDERSRDVERSRLAGDLHAVVLPTLRQAIAEAERGGDPDALARHLRTVDLELERLMADRWPVILEAFGIVEALEDLAERIEADGDLSVEIDVARSADRPPAAIERVAWRVAQIALDNVIRHADAHTIRIEVSVDVGRLDLRIADDGRGVSPPVERPPRPGGRGLADAARRAEAVAGTLRIEPVAQGGTAVSFAWRAPGRGT